MLCPACGSNFEPVTKGNYTTKFCSRSCANKRAFSAETNAKRSKAIRELRSKETAEKREQRSKQSIDNWLKRKDVLLNELHFEEMGDTLRREKILLEQNNSCACCGIETQWNGKPLTFHLDHINGDRSNNTRENLRLICPNCHSQTETYCSKNSRRVTDEEFKLALQNTCNPRQAMLQVGLNPSAKNYERAKRLMLE